MGCRDEAGYGDVAGDVAGDGIWGPLGGSTCPVEQWELCRSTSSSQENSGIFPVIQLGHHSRLTRLSWHLWFKSNRAL